MLQNRGWNRRIWWAESALDSTNPQNPHKKHKMDVCVVWWIRVGKREGILLLAKAKSSKRFCVDSHFVRILFLWILRGLCRISMTRWGVDSHFAYEILRNLMWILQNCVVWLIEVGRVKRTLLFAKAKSSKNFFRFCGIVESTGWILRICVLRVRFCVFPRFCVAESSLDFLAMKDLFLQRCACYVVFLF